MTIIESLRLKHLLTVGALAGIQVSNALVPILLYPFALHMLGADAFSHVVIAEAVAMIVLTLVLYSFDVDGVARIAPLSLEADLLQISDIFSLVLWTRLAIFIGCLIVVLGALALLAPDLLPLVGLWMLLPLGFVLNAFWFYQGLERNIVAAILALAGRSAAVAVVFVFVRSPADAFIVPLAIGGCFVAGGLLSLIYVVSGLGISLQRPDPRAILNALRAGKEIFVGNLSVMMYRDMNVLILGGAGAPAPSIAAYSMAEKLVKMLQASTRPLTQFFFPRLLRQLSPSARPGPDTAAIIGRYTLPQVLILGAGLLVAAVGTAGLLLLTDLVQRLPVGGDVILMAAIMSSSMFFGIGNFMFGVAGLNALGAKRYMVASIVLIGVLNVAVCWVMASVFEGVGAAVTFVVAEAALFALILIRYQPANRAAEVGY